MPQTNHNKPRLAIDIGGTFTDVALSQGDSYQTSKLLTTHQNPVEAVLEAADIALQQANVEPAELAAVIHGTTLATNALIERRGAKVGAIVTEGFRDILEDDCLIFETPGGAGYGEPMARNVETVCSDVLAGLISHENAQNIYGVIIDSDYQIDYSATESLRRTQSLRKPA